MYRIKKGNRSRVRQPEIEERLAGTIEERIAQIRRHLSHTEDLVLQRFSLHRQAYTMLYLEALIDKTAIQSAIIQPLLRSGGSAEDISAILASTQGKRLADLHGIIEGLLGGCCVLLPEQGEEAADAMLLKAELATTRNIQMPRDEQVVKGAHDGFIESLTMNLYLLRQRLKNPRFKVKYFTMGRVTKTKVAMVYMDGTAEPKLVQECERRLNALDLDYLYSVGNIDEMIEEHPLSPFPQTLQTERPDRTVSYLTEGKITVLVDGHPSALILPITFFAFYQSPDDYNSRWLIGSFFRFIRLISFVLAICLPAIYIATVTYHSEVLPIGILYSVKVSLTYVPLPPLVEALVMQTMLELLKEAAIRLPTPVSQTIGIVGGLVIGTAVVEAQLVSHTMIVVIGLTAIASFVTPINEFGTSLRVLGFPMMLAASVLGFFGIAIMLMLIFIHLCKIETLGVPYFTPFGPFRRNDTIKDILLRIPLWVTQRDAGNDGRSMMKQILLGRWKRS
ncbi:spore germination protein [Paenibacillus silvisoli]|uniref:spore germination protein n=1 Tax=Paenibacillus silvisoli TaxID=3110539 RepID=UPI00280566E7|nr:spore germination protein [Paenibacillus silvisoli]